MRAEADGEHPVARLAGPVTPTGDGAARGAASFAEAYRRHEAYSAFSQEHRQAGSIPVDLLRVRQADCHAVNPATHALALRISLGGSATVSIDFGEGRCDSARQIRGIHLNPISSPTPYHQVGEHDVLFISAPFVDVARRLGMESSALALALRPLRDDTFKDARLRNLCLGLWEHSVQAGPFASLAVDHGMLALATALLARTQPNMGVKTASTALDSASLSRVTDYIEASLAEPFQLVDLADAVGLSIWQLSRAFKAATGQSPHQYILDRRCQRVREMLVSSDVPLAQVAYDCGFASQSHMTSVFRARLGITPGRYRRALRG